MALPLPFLSTEVALLPSLLLLETVLSADNALALASLVSPLRTDAERRQLLNWGLATAIVLRLLAVAAAGPLLRLPPLRLLGGGYLIWLAAIHFRGELQRSAPRGEPSRSPHVSSRMGMVLLLAGTNLAFSLDSICAALALTDNIPLVMIAAVAGMVVLRGLTGLVVRGLERCPNLANAGYLSVLAVGLRLVVEQVAPPLTPSEPWLLVALAVFFGWGLLRPQPVRP